VNLTIIFIILDLHGMSTTIDTFIYLKRDIEQSFQRLEKISISPTYHQQEINQLINHISCTLDDLQKVNQSKSNTHPLNLSDDENEEPLLSSTNPVPTADEREEFIVRMKVQFDYYKNKIPPRKNEDQMEIIRLDQAAEDENEDQIIRKQDEQLEDIHHSIISLKNLTTNMNFEINDHIRVLDNLETDMVSSQNRVENLTKRTKNFIRISADGVGGHTCLFAIAVGLFFLIIILILFF
jgi:flagellin-like hook-associated protein FlgL